jgi:hypothetical protein
MMIKPVSAQTIPTPSIPQFTLQTVDNFLQTTIQNQPIIPNGHDTADIFYNIRIKSHDSENWVSTTVPNPYQGIRGYIGEIGTSGSTVLQESFSSIDILLGLSDDFHQIDYQVEAINGYLNTTPAYVPPIGFDPNSTPVIVVNTSGWSSTQTVSIPPYVPLSPTPAPSSSSSAPTLTPVSSASNSLLLLTTTIALVVIAFLLAVIIALLLYMRKRNRLLESNLKGLTKANTSSMRAPRVSRTILEIV